MRVSWSVIAFGRPKVTHGLGLYAVEIDEAHPQCAVGVKKGGEMGCVEPGGMLPDLPHNPAHALIALARTVRWDPRLSWSYFGRRAHGGRWRAFLLASRLALLALGLGLGPAPRLAYFAFEVHALNPSRLDRGQVSAARA
jgi:hypothetical protein